TMPGRGATYQAPKFDFNTAAGCIEALKSPNYATRYMAWTALHAMGGKAEAELQKLLASDNPVYRARALWLLGKTEGRGPEVVAKAITDRDADIRIVGLRLARQLDDVDAIDVAGKLASDKSAQVRRECAIALANSDSDKVPQIWAQLASQHDGQDRWYLEALGIGARGRWDACVDAWLENVGGPDAAIKSAAGRDIVWRSRAKKTPGLLAKILQSGDTAAEAKPRYFRAFDFLTGPEKDEALKGLLGL
ncbi:MAG: dehydrogenase, partial [Planctomycetales bacterium]|nr:dehydrogenase [Planctomycetales bacterium]